MKKRYYTFNLKIRTEGVILLFDLEEINKEEALHRINKILQDYKYIFKGRTAPQYLKVMKRLEEKGLIPNI